MGTGWGGVAGRRLQAARGAGAVAVISHLAGAQQEGPLSIEIANGGLLARGIIRNGAMCSLRRVKL